MEKERYEAAELEIIRFLSQDVILYSQGGVEDEDEGPFVPGGRH